MPVQANNKFQQIAYQPGKSAGGTSTPVEEPKEKKKSGGGGGGRSASAAPAANPAYKEQMDKWQSNLNSLQKPSMEKPTYTDSYADRIAAMEQAGTPVYNSKYQQQIDALLDQVAGRGSFNYDVGSDPLYQAYKNQYVQGGRLAMQDTMGQAAALTGGYGSSYASTAGNQAYQQYLGGLNDQLLNLQSNALARYEAEGNRLQNLLGNYQAQESSDYNRYRDQVGDYYDKLNALRQGQSVEYGRYQDALSQYNQDYDRALSQYNQEYLTALEQYLQWSDRYNNI